MNLKYLTDDRINKFIDLALEEDIGKVETLHATSLLYGDHSSLASVPENAINKAQLLIKDKGILAGAELANNIFTRVDRSLNVETFINDGENIKSGDIAFNVAGNARSILKAERLVLNCMQRMSGIATYTNKLKQLISNAVGRGHTPALQDTRKTTPNFRMMEKWAVAIGGGVNHRLGLYDMILLKDNHIDYAGGIRNAIEATQKYLKKNELKLKIEIETRNIAEVNEVLKIGGVDRIMLDNMPVEEMKKAVKLINNRFEIEASGGITEKNIAEVAKCGVDYISVGALTHSAKNLDMSLKAF
ncbi:MAG: carboxylating nicotinate-nucleotide diphosphorylase [Cytophagales bacterium]|nr:carboxylating nicotinate-nucleotide diphosphorylase [Cytophagales bacterium]